MTTLPPSLPIDVVPDATMQSFLDASRVALEACWAAAHAPNPSPVRDNSANPKGPACEAIQAIDNALKSAVCGDGADAVLGFSLVATSLARKAMALRQEYLDEMLATFLQLPPPYEPPSQQGPPTEGD